MTLKPIVAGICALSISSVAMAGAAVTAPHYVDGMKAKIAHLETVLDQNQGQAHSFTQLPMKGWQDRVTVSGLVNVDGVYANRIPTATTGRFASTNKYIDANASGALFFDAEVNCWTTVHVAMNYFTNSQRVADQPRPILGNLNTNSVNLDEAYVTISNFAKSPLYVRAGRQYVDFGNYYRYPITASFTQILSQTRADALTVGYNEAGGFNASAYVFRGLPKRTQTNRTLNNGGVHIAYSGMMKNIHFNADADWIANMSDANYIQTVLGTRLTSVPGISLHGDMTLAQFDAAIDYVAALKRFSITDVPASAVRGAEPRAAGLDLGYSFATMGLPSRVGAGYQRSWNANNLSFSLPYARWYAQYGVELGRNTDLTFQLVRDKDYGATIFRGTGRTATSGIIRLGIRFA